MLMVDAGILTTDNLQLNNWVFDVFPFPLRVVSFEPLVETGAGRLGLSNQDSEQKAGVKLSTDS